MRNTVKFIRQLNKFKNSEAEDFAMYLGKEWSDFSNIPECDIDTYKDKHLVHMYFTLKDGYWLLKLQNTYIYGYVSNTRLHIIKEFTDVNVYSFVKIEEY